MDLHVGRVACCGWSSAAHRALIPDDNRGPPDAAPQSRRRRDRCVRYQTHREPGLVTGILRPNARGLAPVGEEIGRMKALCWQGDGDIRCDTVPDPVIEDPRDVIIKVKSCAICGSDLHLMDGLDLQQPQPRRALVGSAQGVARGGHPLREDRHQLRQRPLPRRRLRLDQVTTDPGKIGAYTGNVVPVPVIGGPDGIVGAPLAVAGGVANAAVGVAGGALGVVSPHPRGMITDAQKAQIFSQLTAMQPGPQYEPCLWTTRFRVIRKRSTSTVRTHRRARIPACVGSRAGHCRSSTCTSRKSRKCRLRWDANRGKIAD